MSHKTQSVATATETAPKEAMVYDVVGLTEQQADAIIETGVNAQKEFHKTGNQCDFLKSMIDSVDTTEEKIYAAFVAGKMSEEEQNPFSFLDALSN